MSNLTTALMLCAASALLYYLYSSGGGDGVTPEERAIWDNLTRWLENNGAPKSKFKLGYFPQTGRGVAVTTDVEAGEVVAQVPFSIAMNSSTMELTKLGQAIRANSQELSTNAFLSICLFYEKLKGDSFWKPYIDILPTDYSNMPLYFTEEERAMLDGPILEIWEYQVILLQYTFETCQRVEKSHPEFKGLADMEGLRWAASAVLSRAWAISGQPGRSLVPLLDMVNHHPKGFTLEQEGDQLLYSAKEFYPSGSQFFVRHYSVKGDSDHHYLLAYGFMMNQYAESTYKLDFNYGVAQNENVQEILRLNECGSLPQVLSDTATKIPQHFMDCATIFALDELNNPNIMPENYNSHISRQVKLRARHWVDTFFDQELAKFKHNDEQELLLRPDLTYNMRNILSVRMSEKKVLRHGKELLKKLI